MVKYYRPPLFQSIDNLAAAVSQRDGGVSRLPYDSLNLGLHVGDAATSVIENRRRFCNSLQLDLQHAICCEQVHGTKVQCVSQDDCGKGTLSLDDVLKGVDGLVTAAKEVPLLLFFADCAPVFLYDRRHHAIALLHAGWRGTVGDIVGSALRLMQKQFATQPADCLAALGPCIGAECYTVGDDFYELLLPTFGHLNNFYGAAATAILFKAGNKLHFSLYQANRALLLEHGVPANSIGGLPPCTDCFNDSYFSYRAERGKTGRHAAIFCLH